MGTNWAEFANSKAVKIAGFLLLGMVLLVVGSGIFTNKHIKLGPIEFNGKDTIIRYETKITPDTSHMVLKPDTVRIPIYAEVPTKSSRRKHLAGTDTSKPSLTQNSSGGPNNAVGRDNTGIMAKNVFSGKADSGAKIHVGDNVYGSFPRKLDTPHEKDLLIHIPNKNSRIIIDAIFGDAESLQFSTQIRDFLISQGYSKVDWVKQTIYAGPVIGSSIYVYSDTVEIVVGSKPQ